MAASRYESRKQNVVDEANAIGTAYLRTELLPEPGRTAAADLFRQYTDVRLGLARPDWYLNAASLLREKASKLQLELWAQGVAAAQADQRAVTTGLFVSALNEAIDSQARRDAGLKNHVPETVLFMIFAVAVAVMAMALMALLITLVVFVIMDLDRPYRGLITVSQQAMIDARAGMGAGAPLP
jgi:hypothetical protein